MKSWQIVDSEIFTKIFDYYWNESPPTILEIQNITSLKNNTSDVRAFIGKSCRPEDWMLWNKSNLETIPFLEDYLQNGVLGMCLLENGPRVVLFDSSFYNIILGDIFKVPNIKCKNVEFSLCFWYTKDNKQIYRVRSWEVEEWKSMVYEYIMGEYKFPERYKKDDLILY